MISIKKIEKTGMSKFLLDVYFKNTIKCDGKVWLIPDIEENGCLLQDRFEHFLEEDINSYPIYYGDIDIDKLETDEDFDYDELIEILESLLPEFELADFGERWFGVKGNINYCRFYERVRENREKLLRHTDNQKLINRLNKMKPFKTAVEESTSYPYSLILLKGISSDYDEKKILDLIIKSQE